MGTKYSWSSDSCSTKQQSDRLITCAAGTIMAALLADGSLAPCPLFSGTDFKSAPIWNSSLSDTWSNADCFKKMRSISLREISTCYECCNSIFCGPNVGCRARAYMEFGTIYAPDPDCGYNSPTVKISASNDLS